MLATIVVLAVAGAVVALLLLRDGGGTLTGPESAPFSLEYPAAWEPYSAEELLAFDSPPLGVVRRDERDAIIVIRRDKPFSGNLGRFARDLREELDDRLRDFRESAARLVEVEAGNAFYYSYVRTQQGTAHIIVIVPAGDRSYVMNAVIRGDADDAARETGEIIRSFDVERDEG